MDEPQFSSLNKEVCVMDAKNKWPVVSLATDDDLDQIMAVEHAAYGEDMSASESNMRARIERCNKDCTSILDGFMWVVKLEGKVIAIMAMQPFSKIPEECTSWEAATDNGTFQSTWCNEGPNLYVAAFAAYESAYALGAADILVMTATLRYAKWKQTYPDALCMFMARIPGLARAQQVSGISPHEYFVRRREDGKPFDPILREFSDMTGYEPTRLVENGYRPDQASLGFGGLFVLTNPWRTVRTIYHRVLHNTYMAGMWAHRTRRIPKPKDERAVPLYGGDRTIWDIHEKAWLPGVFAYLPHGCSWGKCPFCGFRNAVDEYISVCFDGMSIQPDVQVLLFQQVLEYALRITPNLHTLYCFNGGSFLGPECHEKVRTDVIDMVAQSTVKHMVIETLPMYLSKETFTPLSEQLAIQGIRCTVRIGVETGDHTLRNTHLKKGISDRQIRNARIVTRTLDARLGAYVMLAPATDEMIRAVMEDPDADQDTIDQWCVDEVVETVHSMLAPTPHGFGLDECYLGATCVAPDTPLSKLHSEGKFRVPTLGMMCRTLTALRKQGLLSRVDLLPSIDTPPFKAVPGLTEAGEEQGYETADSRTRKCADLLERYRTSRVPEVLDELCKALKEVT